MKKIHILYNFRNAAWGGGNQFMKVLRHEFQKNRVYTDQIRDADIILFSSHHQMEDVIKAKLEYPDKYFVHRIGSVFTYARGDKYLDRLVIDMNKNIADGTIFQSRWQEEKYHEVGLPIGIETIIHNAPDNSIFNTRPAGASERDRIRIITTGWSTGDIKGFDIYEYLDKHLDFNKYQFIFLGNLKTKFQNIESFPPQISAVVASMLKGSDLFLTATQYDACSNSLLEALHCGLPVVARNSGGHPELVGSGGLLFDGKDDVLDAIETVSSNLNRVRKRIRVKTATKIAEMYYQFCTYIVENTVPKQYRKSELINHRVRRGTQKVAEMIRRVCP